MTAAVTKEASSGEVAAEIPFIDLKAQYLLLKAEIDANIQRVLDHGRFIMGPEVAELEDRLADLTRCKHVVGVSSGTDALLISLMAKGVGPGDAVFVPGFTFTASAEIILMLGARPVFVDVDARTFNIDSADLLRRIEEVDAAGQARPKAILAVDLFGLPADYAALGQIAEEHSLFLLADAAQSLGARQDERSVGTLAPVTATSFFPAKPLGCYGDGGAVFTDDDGLSEAMRSIRLHGRGAAKYNVVRVGVNGRLDTLQAAILLAKLEVFADELARRQCVADWYDSFLAGHVMTPQSVPGSSSAWAQYTVQLDERDVVKATLQAEGIPSAVYYPRPMHLQPAYRAYGGGEGSLPVSERLCRRVLSLPMHPYMGEETVERICAALIRALETRVGTDA